MTKKVWDESDEKGVKIHVRETVSAARADNEPLFDKLISDFDGEEGIPKALLGMTLLYVALDKKTKYVKKLLNMGADPNWIEEKERYTALHMLSTSESNEDSVECASALLAHGADVESKARNGMTPLHFIVLRPSPHSLEMARMLTTRNNVNMKSAAGLTPAQQAEEMENTWRLEKSLSTWLRDFGTATEENRVLGEEAQSGKRNLERRKI